MDQFYLFYFFHFYLNILFCFIIFRHIITSIRLTRGVLCTLTSTSTIIAYGSYNVMKLEYYFAMSHTVDRSVN